MTSQGNMCWQVSACDLPMHPDLHRLYKHKLEMKRNEMQNGSYMEFNMGTYCLVFLNAIKGPIYHFCVFIIVCKIPHVFANEHFLNAIKGLFYHFCVFIIGSKNPNVFANEHFLNAIKGLFYHLCVFIIGSKIPDVFANEIFLNAIKGLFYHFCVLL